MTRRHDRERNLRRTVWALLSFPVLALVLFWIFLPTLISPVVEFEQGPGAAVAYVSLIQQLRAQQSTLDKGGNLTLRFTEPEWNGLLASAVLSGRGPEFPVKKIRSVLLTDGVRLDMVVQPPAGALPSRFEHPIGLQADLGLIALDGGHAVTFGISRLRLGWLTVPNSALKLLASRLGNPLPWFDPSSLHITLPLAEMIQGQIGRPIKITQITLNPGQVVLIASVGPAT